MENMEDHSVDTIMTSPPYNTNFKAAKKLTLTTTTPKGYSYVRYDTYSDGMTTEEYSAYTVNLFQIFDRILKPNGCVIYNLSYGNNNTTGMFLAVAAVIQETNFTLADDIIWKKSSALPNNCSPNKLTRICEHIFIFCRKSEVATFHCNKRQIGVRKTGQASFENVQNFIEAPNNSVICPYNKATYSEEMCQAMLQLYAPTGGLVFDPFIGSGTTAVVCIRLGLHYLGAEISKDQCEWAEGRVLSEQCGLKIKRTINRKRGIKSAVQC